MTASLRPGAGPSASRASTVGAPGVGAPGVGAFTASAPGVGEPGVRAHGVGAPSERAPAVSAPGKLMISGEYVVLDGAPALVLAVDARARVRWVHPRGSGPVHDGSRPASGGSPDAAGLPPEALLARAVAERALGPVPMDLALDVTAQRRDGLKLGLGSSAAAAAAAAAAVHAAHGADLADPGVRRAVLAHAFAGHRAVAPQGSGADVAASALGGLVAFARPRGIDNDSFEADPLAWPESLVIRIVWTGAEARTSDLLARVRALREADPARYAAVTAPLRDAAAALGAAVRAGQARAAVAAAGAHGEAMAALGEAAGAPVVEARLRAIAALARTHGGAAKPSGAGGGDVALAFFDDPAAADRFGRACSEAGATLVSLRLGAEGVRVEPPPPDADAA
jgi:phosphomevalonate kinase